jgi:hypothetical protein
MKDQSVQVIMGGKNSGPLSDTPVPNSPPSVPEDLVDAVISSLSGHVDAVFVPWIADRYTLEWLSVDDDRLGMTRFEEGSSELLRRRKLRIDPGQVTIGLHPALLEDEALYRHTFAHELFPRCRIDFAFGCSREIDTTSCPSTRHEGLCIIAENAHFGT